MLNPNMILVDKKNVSEKDGLSERQPVHGRAKAVADKENMDACKKLSVMVTGGRNHGYRRNHQKQSQAK